MNAIHPIGVTETASVSQSQQNYPQSLCGEVWRELAADKEYLISSHGRVYSLKREGALLKCHPSTNGYLKFNVHGKNANTYVHRVVAETFIPKVSDKPMVCHRDGDKKNNRVENLYWGDHADNMNDLKIHSGSYQKEVDLLNPDMVCGIALSKALSPQQLSGATGVPEYLIHYIRNNVISSEAIGDSGF